MRDLQSLIREALAADFTVPDEEIASRVLGSVGTIKDLRALVFYLVREEVLDLRGELNRELNHSAISPVVREPSRRIVHLIGGDDAEEVQPSAVRETWLGTRFYTVEFGYVESAQAEAKHIKARIKFLANHRDKVTETINDAIQQWEGLGGELKRTHHS